MMTQIQDPTQQNQPSVAAPVEAPAAVPTVSAEAPTAVPVAASVEIPAAVSVEAPTAAPAAVPAAAPVEAPVAVPADPAAAPAATSQESGFLDSMITKGVQGIASLTGYPDPVTGGNAQGAQPSPAPQKGFFGKLFDGAKNAL